MNTRRSGPHPQMSSAGSGFAFRGPASRGVFTAVCPPPILRRCLCSEDPAGHSHRVPLPTAVWLGQLPAGCRRCPWPSAGAPRAATPVPSASACAVRVTHVDPCVPRVPSVYVCARLCVPVSPVDVNTSVCAYLCVRSSSVCMHTHTLAVT